LANLRTTSFQRHPESRISFSEKSAAPVATARQPFGFGKEAVRGLVGIRHPAIERQDGYFLGGDPLFVCTLISHLPAKVHSMPVVSTLNPAAKGRNQYLPLRKDLHYWRFVHLTLGAAPLDLILPWMKHYYYQQMPMSKIRQKILKDHLDTSQYGLG
jgi:hypothetical protein